jgi:hypothetical protein
MVTTSIFGSGSRTTATRLRRERWVAVRSYLHAYARSPDSRWFMGLITAALLELKDEGWTRG